MPPVGVVSSSQVLVPRPVALATGLLLALASPHALAVAPASTPGEVAAPTMAPSSTGPLRVTVAPAIGDASLIPGWIAERNPGLAEKVPSREGHEQWIEVDISGDTYDYRVRVKAMRNGAEVEPAAELVACDCNNEKLFELVDEHIAKAVERLEPVAPQEPGPTNPAERGPDSTTTLPDSTTTPEGERRRISALGIGGIATGGLGFGGLVGGTVMVLLKPQPVRGRESLARNYDVPGIAALAVGGTVLAAGMTMLVVDIIQCRKPDAPPRCYRGESRDRRLEVAPSLEANGGGISILGRF
jgi:hypothetical protein